MLRKGSPVPDVTLVDGSGRDVRLLSLCGKGPLVVYFYPKDETWVCTKEACMFRDAHASFNELGAIVFGISADPPGSHADFTKRHQLPFTLLSDPGDVAFDAFGLARLMGFKERATFVIDAQGSIKAAITGRLSAGKHVRGALEALRAQRLAKS